MAVSGQRLRGSLEGKPAPASRDQPATFEAPGQGVVLQFPLVGARRRAAALRRARARRRAGMACALAATLALVLLGGGGGTAQASRSDAPRAVVVKPGETVWDLARRYGPTSMDPRAYVDEVVELNDLQGGVSAGQRIALPH